MFVAGSIIRTPYRNARGNPVVLAVGMDGLGNPLYYEGEIWPNQGGAFSSDGPRRQCWRDLPAARKAIDAKYRPEPETLSEWLDGAAPDSLAREPEKNPSGQWA